MPIVSVPIATYNRAHYLGPCLDSVLAQTHRELEVVVVDDGSCDETPQVAARYGDRIRYFREEHRGNIATYYRARSLCNGKYMTYFGDDDLLSPNFIERGVAILESDPEIVKFCSDCFMIDREGRRIGSGTYLQAYQRPSGRVGLYDLIEHGCFVHGGIDRRDIFDKVGYYDPEFPHAADYDMYLRMTGSGHSIYFESEPLWSYRIHPQMRSHCESDMWSETIQVLERNAERFPQVYDRLGRKLHRKLGMNKAWLSVRLLWERQFRRSLANALAATRHYPPAVPLGLAQVAYSKLRRQKSIYQLGD